jgi:hypothetical protein
MTTQTTHSDSHILARGEEALPILAPSYVAIIVGVDDRLIGFGGEDRDGRSWGESSIIELCRGHLASYTGLAWGVNARVLVSDNNDRARRTVRMPDTIVCGFDVRVRCLQPALVR